MTYAPPLPSANERDVAFNDADFARVRKLIHRHAGISLGDTKQQMVYSRLARRVRATGAGNFQQYLDDIESNAVPGEITEFVNALTTNLTSFFREAHHFPILAERLKTSRSPFRIWCSAASSGEEPYSIAMTVLETLGKDCRHVSILASDVDTAVLERAMRGIYSMEQVSKLSTERLHRFFLRGKGSTQGYVKVRPELRRLIEFKPFNLAHERWDLRGPFDIIFCRNVMIYFDRDTQGKIIQNMAGLLSGNGLFFAGHSENFHFVSTRLRPVGHTVYELGTAFAQSEGTSPATPALAASEAT